MPYKRTEIGSIDVIGCNFYKKGGKCLIPHYQQNIKYSCCNCLEWDCYYKQLKRKEQECERLKHDNDYEIGALEKIIDNLTVENEKLKRQVCDLRPELKVLIDDTCCKYNIKAKTYHEKIVEIIHYSNKYNQTLVEIKEVLQLYSNGKIGTDKGNGIFEFEVLKDNEKHIYCYDTNPAKRALQKIIECEVQND